eukprot:158581-Pleurochrysis_carterae.AAC.1
MSTLEDSPALRLRQAFHSRFFPCILRLALSTCGSALYTLERPILLYGKYMVVDSTSFKES